MSLQGQLHPQATQDNNENHAESAPVTSVEIYQLITRRVMETIAFYEAYGRKIKNDGTGASNTVGEIEATTSYKKFIEFKPINFSGTEGAVGLLSWIEKMEFIFRRGVYPESCKVKYAACTLQNSALTWWDSYVKTIGIDAAYQISWKDMTQMMWEKYCIQRSERTTLDGKWKNFGQWIGKEPETNMTHKMKPKIKRRYSGKKPYCSKCNKHHSGHCPKDCKKCTEINHLVRNIRSLVRVTSIKESDGCFKCGMMGHFKKDCPKLKKPNVGPAHGRTFVITTEEPEYERSSWENIRDNN